MKKKENEKKENELKKGKLKTENREGKKRNPGKEKIKYCSIIEKTRMLSIFTFLAFLLKVLTLLKTASNSYFPKVTSL